MGCVEGKKSPSNGRDASEKGFLLSVLRPHYVCTLSLCLSLLF